MPSRGPVIHRRFGGPFSRASVPCAGMGTLSPSRLQSPFPAGLGLGRLQPQRCRGLQQPCSHGASPAPLGPAAGGEEGGELPERGRATDSAGSTRPPARPGPLRRRAEGPQPREGRGGGTGRGRAPAGRAGQGCPHLYHSSPRS